jgi:hypothetical protein
MKEMQSSHFIAIGIRQQSLAVLIPPQRSLGKAIRFLGKGEK